MVTSIYWRHSNSKYSDFRRVTTTVADHLVKERDLGLIEFYFLNEEHHVSPHKHKATQGSHITPHQHQQKSSSEKLLKESRVHPVYFLMQ